MIPSEVKIIRISDIDLDDLRFRNRKDLSSEGLSDIKESLKQHGQRVPVILRRTERGKNSMVSGFRRTKALIELGMSEVRALVYDELSDLEAHTTSLIENVQREGLSQLEIAEACLQMADEGIEKSSIASILGKNPRTVDRYLVVANGPQDVRDALQAERISLMQAFEIITREVSLERALKEHLSVRDIVKIGRERLGASGARNPVKSRMLKSGGIDLNIRYRPGKIPKQEVVSALYRALRHLGEDIPE